MEWIDCSKKMPESSRELLFILKGTTYDSCSGCIGWWSDDRQMFIKNNDGLIEKERVKFWAYIIYPEDCCHYHDLKD